MGICNRAFLILIISTLTATAGELGELPPELEAWQAWVMYDTEYLACPVRLHADSEDRQSYLCAWPGILELSTHPSGAHFKIQWKVFDQSWLPLPGGVRVWPLEVQVNGNEAAVVIRSGRPYLQLEAGQYQVTGLFRWDQRPQMLQLPDAIARIDLVVEGEPIETVARDDGQLWLGQRRDDAATEAASASVVVQRKIEDGIPLQMRTRIELSIAGSPREEILGQAMLDGFVPMALTSDLPLRLDQENRLVAQVRPGFWVIELVSRALHLPKQMEPPTPVGLWPDEEIWSFAANPLLRVAVLEGVPAIDALQAGVYPQWQHLPAYLVRSGDSISLIERTRGMARDEGNRLSLQRQLWLDFDAKGYSVLDQISGQMRQGWRLDLNEPLQMTSAEANGPLLVTSMQSGRSGVELRDPRVQLQVGARIEGNLRSLPVGGYCNGPSRSVARRSRWII